MRCLRLVIATGCLLGSSLPAQTSQPVNVGPAPPPRVNADLSVTYFVNAPGAREVRLGDSVFAPEPPGIPLAKGPDGMWSVTTPPYEPGTHSFGFVIDGVLTGDLGGTAHTDRLEMGNLLFEQFDVRGVEPLFTDIRPVPHGTVHIETFRSAALNREVRCFVYTPPGYSAYEERLPVVYLFHIDSNPDGSWSIVGYAERIADNLIADGQMRRVILAMLAGNRDNLPATVMDTHLISEAIPFVEGKYLVRPATERYLAGHSNGATYARNAGLRNPSLFAGIGIFSGGGLAEGRVLEDVLPLLTQPELFATMKPIYIAIGEEDSVLSNVQRLSQSLDLLGIANMLNVTSGGHTWFNWRRYLAEFLKGI